MLSHPAAAAATAAAAAATVQRLRRSTLRANFGHNEAVGPDRLPASDRRSASAWSRSSNTEVAIEVHSKSPTVQQAWTARCEQWGM